MTLGDGDYLTHTCDECGEKYPLDADALTDPVANSPESAEHHADDCVVGRMLAQRGQTESRSAHVDLEDVDATAARGD